MVGHDRSTSQHKICMHLDVMPPKTLLLSIALR